MTSVRATTILAVKRNGEVAVGGDGQVTLENVVAKHNARKVMRLYRGTVLAGVAGAVADAFSLVDLFETKLEESSGNLGSAAIKFARQWRTDRILRQLQAMIIVANREQILLVSGSGEVIEPDDDAAAVGSGASYALAAARALLLHTELPARQIVEESLKIAASICIYTNDRFWIESLGNE
ncbi:MAG TPA: ATP-dependent protease subunit HslV [Armatimonadota bacterium]|nr:ATP-dependent protease subunit HslV [Armatimonadota bacterium]